MRSFTLAIATIALPAALAAQAAQTAPGAQAQAAATARVDAVQAVRPSAAIRPAPPTAPVALLLSTPFPQDPADAAFRRARETLNRGDHRRAAALFGEIPQKYPRSEYAPQAYYWQAFALSRGNAGTDDLRAARQALRTLKSRYPRADVRDADALAASISGQLAQRGDAEAVRVTTQNIAPASQQRCPDGDDESDARVVALNALLQMDEERAVPILKQVLARRDECSAGLRKKAVFLISQKRSGETADILLEIVRNDPDREVRGDAVFWLSQYGGEQAVQALERILRSSTDEAIQEKAIFALSQHQSARASELLRDFAMRENISTEMRGQAIFWLGQKQGSAHGDFLRQIYGRIDDTELKDKIIFSLSQNRDPQNASFLMDIALNRRENIETRKQALFWAGQSKNVSIERLVQLYDQVDDADVREHLIFVYSQNQSRVAIDKLMDIAKNERDAELRKQAVFWLGQSKDPRVARFLLDMING